MSRETAGYRCLECGWTSPKWVGQCRECQAWGTVEEAAPQRAAAPAGVIPLRPARPIGAIDASEARMIPTGLGELDRVLGGGMVPGAVILLAGEPGVGKSTLLLDVAARAARTAREGGSGPVLYLTGEESTSQVTMRARRIGAIDDHLLLAADNDLATVLGHIDASSPSLVVLDSVQTIQSTSTEGGAGGVSQVRAVASALIAVAKERAIPVVLVGHVTKDGAIAGPRTLEHLVDVVCQFEGDRHASLRLLRAAKNRYGPTDEVGCFELTDGGIRELADPSELFLSASTGSRRVPGSCVTVTLEGRRPMPTEIQALVATTAGGSPRRVTSGVDHARVELALAVAQSLLGVDTTGKDVYVSTVSAARATEPAADLATVLAVVSAARAIPVRDHLVAVGELGLTGEIRSCTGVERRLREAARLGFTTALVPRAGSEELRPPPGLTLRPVGDLSEALSVALDDDTPTTW